MTKKLRKLVVNKEAYLWKFNLGYEQTNYLGTSWQCHDIFIACAAGCKASPLQIHFITWEDGASGGPLRTGETNLHTPKLAAKIVQHARQHGWNPTTRSKPFIVENGIKFLTEMGYALTSSHS